MPLAVPLGCQKMSGTVIEYRAQDGKVHMLEVDPQRVGTQQSNATRYGALPFMACYVRFISITAAGIARLFPHCYLYLLVCTGHMVANKLAAWISFLIQS